MSWYQFEQVDDLGRILFCDDPTLQLECVLGGLETAEFTITIHPAQTPRMPTALFEFRQAVGVGYFGYIVPKGASLDELPDEPQLEGAILFGMRRLPPEVFCELPSPPGWELHEIPDEQPKLAKHYGRTYSRLELRTPDGKIYSRTWVAYDPEWEAAALRHGYVICLCGVELGIRGVYAMTDAQHTPAMRYETFRRGCTLGLTVGGLVTYVGHR
ncbi:hypothetical protein [Streptomyces sp. N50]|uniref:hypothetical protein n=1 Tax=Streptomyces sp. N50 TaxID=3081765 RepID=UPI002961F413|nr:hypothetical protein [Streptomyces sp. N50]WOX08101.1 hypothetical protein R2B38_04090 [Streptomyces sp. N50]